MEVFVSFLFKFVLFCQLIFFGSLSEIKHVMTDHRFIFVFKLYQVYILLEQQLGGCRSTSIRLGSGTYAGAPPREAWVETWEQELREAL